MKRYAPFLFLPLLLALPFASAETLFGQKAIEANAYASDYPTASLPSTIDLNPVAGEDVRAYYKALDGKAYAGNDLLAALKPILMNGQQYYKYDSSDAAWRMYEITDRDWDLSPASTTTYGTYDATKNIITGYQYGSNSDPKNNPYIHTLYRNDGVEQAKQLAWGKINGKSDHGQNGGIDREHIWPKSRGFGMKDGKEVPVAGARGDIHHLWPGDHPVNSYLHNNFAYGFVDPAKIDTDAGTKYKTDGVVTLAGNYLGTSASLGEGKVFEPQDRDKGDIARACFYMVARYNNVDDSDDGIDAGNPNLFLDDTTSTDTVYSTPTTPVSIGLLRDLLVWHHLDPVDEFEIHRNDLVYRNYGKNRNPFIDYPDWADAIWGSSTYDEENHRTTSYDATPIGVASPKTDRLHAFGDQSPIVSIAIDPSSQTLFHEGDGFVKPKVIGTAEDSSTRDVTSECSFSGFDMNATGEQTVTVTYASTAIQTTYSITVKALSPIVSIKVSGTPKDEYKTGEAFVKPTIIGTAEDGSTRDVTKDCVFSGYDLSKVGKQTVKVTYKDTAITTAFDIEVKEPFMIPTWALIAIAGAAVVIVAVVVVIAINGKGKQKAAARKAVHNVTKAATGSSKKKSASSSQKKRKNK